MNTQTTATLSTVTTDLLTTYGNTAKNVINAYRVGNERVVGFMDQRWERAVKQVGKRLSTVSRDNALAAQKKLSGYYIKGITLASDRADSAVNTAVELTGKGLQQVAANAVRFQKSTGVTTLNTLARVAVPAAMVVSKVASKLEQRSDQLVSAVSGNKVKAKVKATAKRVTAFRKARTAKVAV
jgi:hypothetical protein